MATTSGRRKGNQRAVVRFLFGDELRELDGLDPNTTVLNYVRGHERKCGTKEGCAEGDCGACTVVLGEAVGNRLRWRAVNACILFVPVLDGKQLITVEHLQGRDGALHPAQRAMIDCHGSQCGFCTPGFVMSLFALYESEAKPGRRRIDDVLAGNLCRCTGYRPIAAAAEAMYGPPRDGRFAQREKETVRRLKALRRSKGLALDGAGRRYFAPETRAELARLVKAHPGAHLLAGGTDVGLWVTKGHRDLPLLIYTGKVAELGRVTVKGGIIEIGAAVRLTDAMERLAAHYPGFGEVLRRFGSVQVRNAGTIGGNVANGSPIGDTMPALIALGATVVLRANGRSRETPLDAFYRGYRKTALKPGEFVEAIRVPARSAARRFNVYKVSKRFDQDISGVLGAYALELDGERVRDIRICYGGLAATPKRALACERALIGRPWTQGALANAFKALDEDYRPLTDMRASADYRRLVARNLLQRFWLETTGQSDGTSVAAYAR